MKKIDGAQWSSMEIHGDQWRSMEFDGASWSLQDVSPWKVHGDHVEAREDRKRLPEAPWSLPEAPWSLHHVSMESPPMFSMVLHQVFMDVHGPSSWNSIKSPSRLHGVSIDSVNLHDRTRISIEVVRRRFC